MDEPAVVELCGRTLISMELLLLYAHQTTMGSRRHSLVLVLGAAALVACKGGGQADTSRLDAGASSTTSASPADAPTLVAYRAPCKSEYDTDCASEAAEFAGTVQVEDGCVLVDTYAGGPIERNPRSLITVLFPYGVSWSTTDDGIITSDGDIAHRGDWIYGGGGGSPLADLELLDLTDQQRSDLERCAATSDSPERFAEMGANDSITLLEGPPDF